MSGKKKKSQSKSATAAASSSASQRTTSEDGSARMGAAKEHRSASAAANSSGSRDSFIRDLPAPSQTVQHRGMVASLGKTSGGAITGATNPVVRNGPPHFSHLEQPIPMTHSCSLPSLPSTSLRPRMTSISGEGGGEYNDPSNTSHVDRDLSKGDLQQLPSAPVPLLSRTLSTPESSSNSRSAFGRAGSAFGRFSTAAASRPNTTYTQSDPGFSAFHPVTWNCQRSLSSAGSGSLVGSEIIEENDVDSGVKATARTSSAPSNNMTRGFLLKAREKLQTTKRRSGRENPARPSLSDADDVSSRPATIITNNDDGVEISIAVDDKTVPPKIERVSPPTKMGVLRKSKRAATKSNPVANEGYHEDPGLELNFTDSDDDGSIDEVIRQPSVEVALKTESKRPPSRADNTSQVPLDEKAQTYSHSAIAPKISAMGAVAAKFKFKSPARNSKSVIDSPSSYATSSSPHQSPSAGTTSSSSNGSPDSRGGLSTISSNSNSISSAANMRSKINSAASSPGGGDSCAKESMGSSTTNSEIRDFVRESQKKSVRPPRPAGKESNVEDYETVSVDMDGNATVHSSSVGSCSSPCLREGAINPHIGGLTLSPGEPSSSVSLNRFPAPAHEAPFDEQSGGPEVGGNTNAAVVKKDDSISKFIAFASKKEVRSQSPHSADVSASASNASVSNATSSSSGGGSQQPVMFVAYERVEEREGSPFDEHHHEENRIETPQNLIRPTITNAGTNNIAGQRPPVSPRKMMSGRVSTPSPTHAQNTLLSGAITPASPPTIADRHVLVRDLAGVASGSRPSIPKPKSNRMKMILVPPKKHTTTPTVVSPERHHSSQSSVNIENLQQQVNNSAIVSPEKAN
mmetsp:Transcript_7827/g.12233  ORF Transcript_7827/g.12233 Transcript_7827/m.12233 type:complete len:858 (-) Transcript_7827:155-2728(-)